MRKDDFLKRLTSQSSDRFIRVGTYLTLLATIFALIVITLGAYTRITNAGLACPDWPGCYNRIIAPYTEQTAQQAQSAYPNVPVQITKAWTEMVHRYAAGALGLMILGITFLTIYKRKLLKASIFLPILLPLLVILQILLGKWTVTLLLMPVIVMGHLLGGLALLAILWWLHLCYKSPNISPYTSLAPNFRPWAVLGLLLLILQISLGGWTSANYAALVCPDFPYCYAHQYFPQFNLQDALLLDHATASRPSATGLITIHMLHRIGACIVAIYLGVLGLMLILNKSSAYKRIGTVLIAILMLQLSLGILNIVHLLPLPIAVAHNTGAALLLLTMVTLIYATKSRSN